MTKSLGQIAFGLTPARLKYWDRMDQTDQDVYKHMAEAVAAHVKAEMAAEAVPLVRLTEAEIEVATDLVGIYGGEYEIAIARAVEAALIAKQAATAQPVGCVDTWQPIETAPKDIYIHVQQAATYRWMPYKPNSQEWKRGKKGRWQKHTGYGFDNAELEGTGWKSAEVNEPTPPQPEQLKGQV